jgi:hypothetical protein
MSSERQPLLTPPTAQNADTQPDAQPTTLNQLSRAKLYWILAALWTAVFLGAMDGTTNILHLLDAFSDTLCT